MNYQEIQATALEKCGIIYLVDVDLADYAPYSDGCSGGVSTAYALLLRQTISCHKACVTHDWLYEYGGNSADRKRADKLLRLCAAKSGSVTGRFAPVKKAWRWIRAWGMWVAVRLFGKNHFTR